MRRFMIFWEKTARLPFWQRLLLKIGLFGGVLFLVLYPRPGLFVKQLENYFQMDALIQADFPGLEAINREIDLLLEQKEHTPRQEFLTVQSYVYRHIKYAYDWETWGNIDFWPTAQQVWELQQEDCDGRAILAASILRARGFESARLAGNVRHIWVEVEDYELMGPDTEKTIRREGDKLVVTLPSLQLLLGSTAIYIADFPAIRHLILFFTAIILLYHPAKNLTHFLGMTITGLVGFLLLKDWAHQAMESEAISLNGNFWAGNGLMLFAIGFALWSSRIHAKAMSEIYPSTR
ncbi:hypothetical protein U27_01282 [Candidatus Vecturithrix granuli]|uniref:Transglutaminase-like domain-containing protein n=1 Tax=Vecturithrix granuli TaxID=1499967 RepID=A0A081C9X7_VECG1|nr:hypothetical protein U27_01282 [Candidatus Vecturithrix granuli]